MTEKYGFRVTWLDDVGTERQSTIFAASKEAAAKAVHNTQDTDHVLAVKLIE